MKIVLQVVDGQDVLLMAARDLEPRLQRRFTKEEMDMALLAAEDQLTEALKASKKGRASAGGTD